jgi:hypothetical protein
VGAMGFDYALSEVYRDAIGVREHGELAGASRAMAGVVG